MIKIGLLTAYYIALTGFPVKVLRFRGPDIERPLYMERIMPLLPHAAERRKRETEGSDFKKASV